MNPFDWVGSSRLRTVVLVLVVGYSIYGGLFLTAVAVHDTMARDELTTGGAFDPRSDAGDGVGAFDFVATDAGFEYEYHGTVRGSYMDTLSNAGVYAGDYNGDGWPDLLAVGGESPTLFENVGGTFEPSGALPPLSAAVRSAMFLDYDGDGRVDILFLVENAPPVLLHNDGGSYRKTNAFEKPLTLPFGATTADYNNDSHLDLFVYQYGDSADGIPIGFRNYSAPVNGDNGNPNVLYRGTGSGFERVDAPAIRGSRWSLAASFVDLTGDGSPDVHVANDFNHDVVYANRGNGTFEQIVLPEGTNRNGMSSEIGDVTGDGRPDVFATNIYYPDWLAEHNAASLKARGNNLIASRGGGSFALRGQELGVNDGGWGWASVLADFDNDGDQDLFHTTTVLTFQSPEYQMILNEEELRRLREMPFYRYPSVWARDRGVSFRHVDPEESGFEAHNGRGAARLDYDLDGDVDLAVATAGTYRLYENRMDGRHAIQIRLLGENGSPSGAYGASVAVNATSTQRRWVIARTDYLSQDSRVVHVGVGNATTVDVRIVWPDGAAMAFEDVAVGQRLIVTPDGIRERTPLS